MDVSVHPTGLTFRRWGADTARMSSAAHLLASPIGAGVLSLLVSWVLPWHMELVRGHVAAAGKDSTQEFDGFIVKLRRIARRLRHVGITSIVLGVVLALLSYM